MFPTFQWLRFRLASTRREEGQTLIEYALIISLVSVAVMAALTGVAGGVDNILDTVATTLGNAGQAGPD